MNKRHIILICTIMSAALVTAFFYVSLCRGCERIKEDDSSAFVKGINDRVTNESCDPIPGIDRRICKYMNTWDLKGTALAVTRNDSLVYAKGYGIADEGVEMQPGIGMRVASVSKLITATAIMRLCDDDLLSLQDTVFGPSGILNEKLYANAIGDRTKFYSITVEHLLRHQGGFAKDPMFGVLDLMKEYGSPTPLTHDQTIDLGLRRGLRFAPGESHKYSNFGYLLLCDVIEKVSGMPYEEYVRREVMDKAGCRDMRIGGNRYEDKLDNESRQYAHQGDGQYIPDPLDTGKLIERCYGGNDIELLSGAGGWVASVLELARLVACIDGDPTVPDIISSESFARMTETTDENRYSLGWNDTNPEKGWQRTGTLSGTTAMIRRYPDGECWIFLSNSSTYIGPRQASRTEDLFKEMREQCSCMLPHIDMFAE